MNNQIKILIDNPYNYSKSLSVDDLEKIIIYLNNEYYNNGIQVVSDDIYDILIDVLKKKDPKNKLLKNIGSKTEEKFLLPYHMGSMDKIKNDSKVLNRWKKKFDGSYSITDKLDGCSALLHYTHSNKKFQMFTRGDGKFGRNITSMIKYYFKNSLNFDKDITIRGEIIMRKKNFLKYKNDRTNARSTSSGITNSSRKFEKGTIGEKEKLIAKDIDFVAYELLNPPNLKLSEQINFIKNYNIPTVNLIQLDEINVNILSNILEDRRKNSDYEIDGIIITDNKSYPPNKDKNPKHSIAFKMLITDEIAETIVLDVIWNKSRYGILKPKIEYKSVKLCGATLKYATAFNAKYVKDNNIGPGARIKITRSGDVIPFITEVLKGADKPKFPDLKYQWTESGVDIKLTDEEIKKDNTIRIRKIVNFFKVLNINGLKEKTVERIYNSGYDTIKKIIEMKIVDFETIERINKRSAIKFYKNIQNGIKNVPLAKLMKASNIFGIGFGERKAELVLKEHPDILTYDKSDCELLFILNNINGFSDITSRLFINKYKLFNKWLKEHPEITIKKIKSKGKTSKELKYNGKLFLFTGGKDQQVIDYIEKNGGIIAKNIKKDIFMVIAKDINSNSGKIKKAKKLGIQLISLQEFKKKIDK